MDRRISLLAVVGALFVSSACIHVKSRTQAEVATARPQQSDQWIKSLSPVDGVKGHYLIYQPSVYPFETFVKRLMRGELQASLRDLSLSYEPSSTNNEAINKLLENGIVPAYLSLTNHTDEVMDFEQLSVGMAAEGEHVPPLNEVDLPLYFKEFSGRALAANVYNVGVVIGAVGLLIAMMAKHGGGSRPCCFYGGSRVGVESRSSSSRSRLFNSLTHKTEIDYADYLFPQKKLAPGETAEGLVFFALKRSPVAWRDLSLEVKGLD